MRQTPRFPIVLLLFAALGSAAFSSGCYFSKDSRKQRYVLSGQSMMEQKKYKEAQIQFQKAVALDKNYATAWYGLGEASLKLKDYPRATSALQQAVNLRPQHFESNRDLASLLVIAKKFKEARPYAKAALDQRPDDPLAQETYAYTYSGTGDMDDAEEQLESLVSHDPEALTAVMSLAQMKMRDKDPGAAEEILKSEAEKKPTAGTVVTLANFYRSQGKLVEAEALYRKAIQMAPKEVGPQYALGMLLLMAQRPNDAEVVFAKISQEHQDDPIQRGTLARFHYNVGQQEKAVSELEAIVKQYPDDHFNRSILVRALLEAGRYDRAAELISEILKKNPNDVIGRRNRAVVYLKEGKTQEAMNDLSEVLHYQPDSAVAHYYMAKAHFQRNEINLAQQELQDCLKYQPANLPARLALADIFMKQNSLQAADELLKETPRGQERVNGILLARARLKILKADYLAAEQDLTTLTQANPKYGDAFTALGQLYEARKDPGRARAAFERAVQLNPKDLYAVSGLASAYVTSNEATAGEAVFEKMVKADPKYGEAVLGLAQIRMAIKKDAQAEQVLRVYLESSPKDVRALRLMGDLRYRAGDLPQAEAIARQVIQAAPQDEFSYVALATVLNLEKKPQEAIVQYREALKRDDGDAMASNNLAWLLIQNGGNADEAMALAQKSREKASKVPAFADTLGWIYLKKNNITGAVGQFEDALRMQPGNQQYMYHLGLAQYKNAKLIDAEKNLRAAVAGKPTYDGVETARQMLADIDSRR